MLKYFKKIPKNVDNAATSIGASPNMNVTLVGLVTNKSVRHRYVRFTIDDGTGQVDCIRWVPVASDLAEMEDIHEGMYVHVKGSLKPYQGRRHMFAFSVRPVTNFDGVSLQYSESIHSHMQNSNAEGEVITQCRYVNPFPSAPASGVLNGNQAAPFSHLSDQLQRGGPEGYEIAPSSPPYDQRVCNYLLQPRVVNSESGANLYELSQELNIPLENIKESIKLLEEEGRVFSTISDDYYKAI